MTDTSAAQPSTSAKERQLLMIAVLLGTFATAVSAVIVNIALPEIIEQMHARQASAHWLITGFTAAGTLTMLLAPWFGRAIGVRRTFLAALAVFLFASLACGFGNRLSILVTGRILQGSASGLITTLTLVAISNAFPVERRGRAMATFGLGVVLAPMLGPPLGGLLVQAFGWRSVMFAPLPFCLIAFALALRVLPAHVAPLERPRFDWGGFMLLTALLCTLLGGVTYLHLTGWPRGLTLILAVTVAILALALACWEWRATTPIVNLHLFKFQAFAAATCVAFTYGLAVWGSAYMLPLFLQTVCGYTPLEAGLAMLPGGLVLLLMIPVAGRMADSSEPHLVIIAGLVCFAGSFMLLSLAGGVAGLWGFILLALLITIGRGFGLGIMIPALDATASRALPADHMPEGLAMMNFLRQLGGALSPSLLALVLETRVQTHAEAIPSTTKVSAAAMGAGFHDTLLTLGVLFLLAALPAWKMRVRKTWPDNAVEAEAPP